MQVPPAGRHQVSDNLKRYQVTCTNTYRVWAANEDDAITLAEARDNNEALPPIGSVKVIDTTTEIESNE